MKRFLHTIVFLICLLPVTSFSQLPDGSIAPDFTLNDIYGNTHHLYDYLDQGKMVVVEFSATWCGPCWNYMMTGALENFWNAYGPGGTNQAMVLFIEADQTTDMDDLLGLTNESQGNWVAEIPFPIIDLQIGENTDNDYDIAYYPTLFAICSDHRLYEVGQVGASEWAEWITSCSLAAEVADVNDAVCYGEGSATVEATGGLPPLHYHWSNGDNNAILDNVGAGTYSVTVTEGNQRTVVIEDIIIDGVDAPITLADLEIEDVLCNGTNTGNITLSLQDGVPPYDFDWSNGSHAQNLVNVPADEYTVNVTDNNGCAFEGTFTVEEPDVIEVESTLTPEYCDQANGTIVLNISGGVGNYDIDASAGTVFGNSVIDLPAGFVTVTIEDGNGCAWDDQLEIEAEPDPSIYFTPDPQISCTQLTTIVTGYVNDGSGDFTFEWSTVNGHIVGANDQAAVEVDEEGEYVLLITDIFSGCTAENSVEVASTIDPPQTSAGSDSLINCENLQLNLSGSGDQALVVNWTTADGHIVSGGDSYVPLVDAPGNYIIHVLNTSNSCTNTDTVVIENELDPATAVYSYQTSALTMIGTDLSTGSNLGGWSWDFGDGNTATEQSVVHTFSAAGSYNVCHSVQNGCGTSQVCQAVEVTFTGSVISVDAIVHHVLCHGDSTGQVILTVNGGSGNYTYTWTGPNGSTFSTSSLDSIIAGAYQLVVSDDAGNLFIGEYVVTQPDPIVIASSTVTDNICFAQANGSIAIAVAGGVAPFSFSFNGSAFQPDSAIYNLPSGLYDGVISDANGCLLHAGPFTISQPAELSNLSSITNVRCFGEANGAINLQTSGGISPYTYSWKELGATTPEITSLTAGQYACLITDHNGCVDSVQLEVAQPAAIDVTVSVVDATSQEQNNGSITLTPTGGTAPYVITWNTGATGNKIEGLIPGEYSYTIIDTNGCVYTPSGPVIVAGITATEEIDWTEYISITPNPSYGDLVITWKDIDLSDGKVSVLALDGRKLFTQTIGSNKGKWEVKDEVIATGIYIVLIQFDGHSIPFKLIIL